MDRSNHRYNLYDLEEAALQSYYSWTKENSPKTRTLLYQTVKDLAYAILDIGNIANFKIDYERTSYEYSIYLFQRIITGTFKLTPKDGDRFPLQQYIRLNIRHIIYSMRDEIEISEIVEDLDHLFGDEEILAGLPDPRENIEKEIIKNSVSGLLYQSLQLFYSKDDIRRLYPISRDQIFTNTHNIISKNLPEDIHDFCVVLISLSKRIMKDTSVKFDFTPSSKNIERTVKRAVRSTVFLSTISNSDLFPKEMLLSLDIESLYRLVTVAGGKQIRIPTQRELDSLIGASVAISEMILSGEELDESLQTAKKDYNLVMSNKINIRYFISQIMKSLDIENTEKHSEPLINTVVQSIKFIDILFSKILEKSDEFSPVGLTSCFTEVTNSITSITNSLCTIKEQAEKRSKE